MGMLSGLKAIFSNGVANNEVDNLGRYDNLPEFYKLEDKSTLRNAEKAVEVLEQKNPTVSKFDKTKVVENTVKTDTPEIKQPQKESQEREIGD